MRALSPRHILKPKYGFGIIEKVFSNLLSTVFPLQTPGKKSRTHKVTVSDKIAVLNEQPLEGAMYTPTFYTFADIS